MSENWPILLLILTPVVLVLIVQWCALQRARRSEGAPAPDTSAVDDAVTGATRVYYFYAAHCGPCRAIGPVVDRLRLYYSNLIKVDVAVHPDLARSFGIAATPSFVVVADGRIREIKIGAPAESWLLDRLGYGL